MASQCVCVALLLLVSWCVGIVQAKPQYPEDLDVANSVSSKRVRSEPVSIIFDNSLQIVNPGESLSLNCGVAGEFRYCHWNGPLQNLQVQDVHDGLIDGMTKPDITKGNECGIIIDSVTIEDHGSWSCEVYVKGYTLTERKNVTVTIRPTRPVLEVSHHPLMVDEGDQHLLTCSVAAARPQVSIHWFLGSEDITYSSTTLNSLTDNMGTYKSISTLTHMFKAWHNHKALRCIVSHYTLREPMEDYVDISVRYKPWGKDVRLYAVRLGDDVEAKVNFSSNPSPSLVKWGHGLVFEDIAAVLPVPGEEGRYSTEVVLLEDGHYSVILRILEFTEQDVKTIFKVAVQNSLGTREFRVTVSNDKPPNEPLSRGSVAAIVVVVLLLALLLISAAYMRYNHLYCFAVKKKEDEKENNGASSDTESALQNPGFVNRSKQSATNLLGKLQGLKKPKQSDGKTDKVDEDKHEQHGQDKPTDEVVYAELDLAQNDTKKPPQGHGGDGAPPTNGTEYAQIVGVIDNQQQEKKE